MLRPRSLRSFAAGLIAAGLFAAGLIAAGPAVPAGAEEPAAEAAAPDPGAADPGLVLHVRWDDAITPVTRTFLLAMIERATEREAAALLIELDTPGGLLDATRDIVTDFYESPVPVIVWVGPSGARAASAGVFLTMAAHVAAMAPGTNIGAASPVTMGGGGVDSTMAHKMFEDTAAFARSIAERRGRNVEWAEEAVREARSITEQEAVERGVVEFAAATAGEVLDLADGRAVELPGGERELRVAGAELERQELGLRFRILSLLANPNVAYILLMFGMYGLFFELSNPGSILPGVIGVVFLILAFYSMQTLPLNLAGLMLVVVGLALFLLEAHVTSFGFLTVGGIVCTVLGAVMLFDSPVPALRVSLAVALPLAVVTTAFFAVAVGLSVRTMRTRPTTGREGMIGARGTARTEIAPQGTVEVHGEIWRAESDAPLAAGDPVEVLGMEGLLLRVRRGGRPAERI
jgi:membrane-bound serine protease (ClpP class)